MQRDISVLQTTIPELKLMKKYPHTIYYLGNISLLQKPKVSIVGTRRPINYSKQKTDLLVKSLVSAGFCIVSGAAMGIDAIAHKSAGASNTIAVVANGLDLYYPKINKNLIEAIQNEGLILSTYAQGETAKAYHFVQRNEIVVALGEVLIVSQADMNSGSLRSVEYALKMGKEVYVLPHRIGESEGTNQLIKQNKAKVIYDIDQFVQDLSKNEIKIQASTDEFLEYCKTNPTYDEAIISHGQKVFEYELLGKINVENGIIFV